MNSEYELEEAKRQLNQTLNKSLDSEFNVENSVNINRDLIYSDLKQETLKNNNNILFQQYIVEIAKKDKRLILYQYYQELIYQHNMATIILKATQV